MQSDYLERRAAMQTVQPLTGLPAPQWPENHGGILASAASCVMTQELRLDHPKEAGRFGQLGAVSYLLASGLFASRFDSSDDEWQRYAVPGVRFDLCKREHSRNLAILVRPG